MNFLRFLIYFTSDWSHPYSCQGRSPMVSPERKSLWERESSESRERVLFDFRAFSSFFTSVNDLFVYNIVLKKSKLFFFLLNLFVHCQNTEQIDSREVWPSEGAIGRSRNYYSWYFEGLFILFSLFCCLWCYHFLVIDLFSPVCSGCYYSHIWEGCIWAHILSDVCSAVLWTQWKPPIIPSWRAWW